MYGLDCINAGFGFLFANNSRITTKSFIFHVMDTILQANLSMNGFAVILKDLPMNFFDGIFDRRY